jgi:hypothetical protein
MRPNRARFIRDRTPHVTYFHCEVAATQTVNNRDKVKGDGNHKRDNQQQSRLPGDTLHAVTDQQVTAEGNRCHHEPRFPGR